MFTASTSKRVGIGIRVVIGVALIAALLWSAGPARLLDTFRNISLSWLAWAFAAQGIQKVVQTLRWQEVLRGSGMRKGLIDLLAILHIGFFFNNFLPSSMGGDLIRGYYSSDGRGTRATAFGAIFAERLIGLVALAGVCAVAVSVLLLVRDEPVPRAFLWSCLAMCGLVSGGGAVVLLTHGWVDVARRILRGRPKLAAAAVKFSAAMHFIGRPDCRTSIVVALSVLVQIAAVLFYFAVARAVGITLGVGAFFFLVPLAVFASNVPVSPNGVGLREGAFVGLLQLFGVAIPEATAFALLARLVDLVFALLGGGLFLLRRAQPKDPVEIG